jgi:soluble lytic murein transglycosylase
VPARAGVSLLGWVFAILLQAHPAQADLPEPSARVRAEYQSASSALARGDAGPFNRLSSSLRDYPLYPYLELARLRRSLTPPDTGAVEQFLTRYDRQLPAARLRSDWLAALAKRSDWQAWLRHFREDEASLTERCTRAFALWQTGAKKDAGAAAAALWMTPRSLPANCDAALAPWLAQGNPGPEAAWQRFELALDAGETALARYLQRFLDTPHAADATLFLSVLDTPARVREARRFNAANPRHARIVASGLSRLAKSDPAGARKGFDDYSRTGVLDAAGQQRVAPRIAAALALNSPAEALQWVLGLPPTAQSEALTEDALRYALREQDWNGVSAALSTGPAPESAAQRWDYWKTRAAEARGALDGAALKERFAAVRATRSYYGFLAAERIGEPFEMQHRSTVVEPAILEATAREPGIMRAREFFLTGDVIASRREFGWTTARLDERQRLAAARLADTWGWHTLAITTVAAAKEWNDLELRFPVIHREHFDAAGKRQQLDTHWLFAIARQESALNPGARSPVGAMGLMQLMPATAQQTARASGLRYRGSADLLDPGTNVQLGSHYMRLMLDDFGQNRVLAAAAYNAGPGRVRQWLRRLPGPVDHDLFTETIPFKETRQYVQNVLSFAVIYAYLGGRETPLVRPDERVIRSPGSSREPGR